MSLPLPGLLLRICLLLILAPLLLGSQPAFAQDPADEGLFKDMPVVLSATRLRQSVRDAPISMTVIDRQMIKASGFTEIPDLMRLVPGFIVDYDSGHLPVTGYHILHDRYVRQQQVLIDGRSVYTPITGGVPWVDLPITMEDIDRIEVVRGPNAASYGSNSFMGVINIITRDSAVDRGTSIKTNIGDNGMREGFLRHGGSMGDMDYVLSVGYREDHGFEERHDGKEVKLATLRSDYQVNNNDSLIFQLGYNGGTRQEDNAIVPFPEYERQVNSQYQQIRWIRALPDYGELRVQYYHTALDEEKDYGTGDQNFFTERHDIELQHTTNPWSNIRLVWGGSYRRDSSRSEYYVAEDAPSHVNIARLFTNLEYRHSPNMILNSGVMIEDNELAGVDILPRVGVNYHISPRDTVRMSVSRATRVPVMTEEYTALGGTFLYEKDLEPEYITAYEVGYLTETADGSIKSDFKIYYEDITGVINYDSVGLGGAPYQFDNFEEVSVRGLEAQITLQPSAASRIHFTYAHTSIHGTENSNDSKYHVAAPEHTISLLGMWDFERNLSASLGFYYSSSHKQLARRGTDPLEYEPSRRVDFRLGKKIRRAGNGHELSLIVQNVFDETQESRLRNFPERRFYISYRLNLN